MPATGIIHSPLRELARRVSSSVEVTLYWHERSGSLAVSVFDRNSGAYAQFATEPDKAMHTFSHPYASAAAMGVPPGTVFSSS